MTDLVRDEKYSAKKKTPTDMYGSKEKRYTEDGVLIRLGMTLHRLGKEPGRPHMYSPIVVDDLEDDDMNELCYDYRFFSSYEAAENVINEWKRTHALNERFPGARYW
jgi:hypothetical protein